MHLLAVGEEFQREIDTAMEFELYRTFLKALQNALEYARQDISFIGKSEKASKLG